MSVTANRRKARREECTRIVLFLLDQKPNGWHFSELHLLVTQSMRSSITRGGLGLIMRPYFNNGVLVRERSSYHGVESHIWRKQ